MSKHRKEKHSHKNHDDTSPVKLLEAELHALRRDLRTTAHAYIARLETELLASAAALRAYQPAEKLSRERLHCVRELATMLRNRGLKPEKGRQKDLRKIDTLIGDLQPLLDS